MCNMRTKGLKKSAVFEKKCLFVVMLFIMNSCKHSDAKSRNITKTSHACVFIAGVVK